MGQEGYIDSAWVALSSAKMWVMLPPHGMIARTSIPMGYYLNGDPQN